MDAIEIYVETAEADCPYFHPYWPGSETGWCMLHGTGDNAKNCHADHCPGDGLFVLVPKEKLAALEAD